MCAVRYPKAGSRRPAGQCFPISVYLSPVCWSSLSYRGSPLPYRAFYRATDHENCSMTQLCLPPDPDVAPPSFQLPDNATDCHMHLFGDLSRFPCVSDRDYTPAEAGIAAARKLYDVLGIRRIVAIQPSVYGTDNRCQLEFGAALGLPFRAVVVLPSDTPARELDRLHELGVRGIRYILAHPGGLDAAHLERSADQANERGWHLEFLLKPHQLIELEPRLAKLSCPFSFDHLAFVKPAGG